MQSPRHHYWKLILLALLVLAMGSIAWARSEDSSPTTQSDTKPSQATSSPHETNSAPDGTGTFCDFYSNLNTELEQAANDQAAIEILTMREDEFGQLAAGLPADVVGDAELVLQAVRDAVASSGFDRTGPRSEEVTQAVIRLDRFCGLNVD
jgi:hypothetical protein